MSRPTPTSHLAPLTSQLPPVPHTPEANVIMVNEARRIDLIRSALEHFNKSRRDMVASAFVIGFELNAQKDALAHGRFEKWCETNLPEIGAHSRRRYMAFAEGLQRMHAELGQQTRLLLTNGDAGGATTEFGERLFQLTDGASLTQLYRDTGVIPAPKPPTPRERKPAPKPSPEKALALRRQAAAENWLHIELSLKGNGISFVLLEDLEVEAQIAFLEQQVSARKRWVNTPPKKRDAHVIEKFLQAKH